MMRSSRIILFVVSTVIPQSTAADSWPAAQTKEVFSKSREWFVRVVPGQSIGDTVGFAGAPKGPHARAEFYQRMADRSYRLMTEVSLLNPVAPVIFFVTDRGYLVTLDNWHNMGFGKIVVSYSSQGRVIKAYELSDLFSRQEIEAFTHSASSIWWRTETAYVRSGERSVYVSLDGKGSDLVFEPESGAWQHCAWRKGQYRCRDTKPGDWKAYRDPS